jgi:hypothetical protein
MQLTSRRHQPLSTGLLQVPSAARRRSYAQARAKRSGGPVDQALYSCSCGYAFKAPVTTTVGCPHCGQTQAW